MPTTTTTRKQKCAICYEPIKPDCAWKQGRCPHQPAMIDSILSDPYKSRYLNLINSFKDWFKK